MLNVITGKQRAGKTYFCCKLIVQYLRDSKRNIYTNLPLNPDKIARYAAGKSNIAKQGEYLRRIHMFRKFGSLADYRYFRKKNKNFCAIMRLTAKEKEFENLMRCKQLQPDKNIREFWKHTKANSIIILDELYQYFSSTDYRDSDNAVMRKELLTYSRQHGHYKDDMFLVSHSIEDLDAHIRRGCQYLYEIRNSKYTNVFEWKWLRGFKWPVQFFIIQGFEYGEQQPSDVWKVWPDSFIFKCYESFSKAEKIFGKDSADSEAESSDTGVNFWFNFKNFVAQAWMGLAILVALGVGLTFGYQSLSKISNLKSSDFEGKKEVKTEIPKIEEKKQEIEKKQVEAKNAKPETDPKPNGKEEKKEKITVTAVFSNMVTWSDGYKLRVGGSHEGLKIVKIDKENIYFDTERGIIGVRISGVRKTE